jgi:hypothetical protein
MKKNANASIAEAKKTIVHLPLDMLKEIKGGIDAGSTGDTGTSDDSTQNQNIFPNTRTWFFLNKNRLGDGDAIRNRDDNACPSTGYFQWKQTKTN